MESENKAEKSEILKTISSDRQRTNLLMNIEQKVLVYLVQRIPSGISSDMLTGFGLFGSITVFAGFILAAWCDRSFLLLGIPGLCISWFGDSLDGRLAYFRNRPRKLYGFVLDITIDWIGIILIGCGYIIYSRGLWDLLGYGFVVFYGWEMIIALIRYKFTGEYSIDSGKLGPTEARIILMAIFITEVIIPDSIIYTLAMAVIILFTINILDTRKLLLYADKLDKNRQKDKA